LWVLKYQIPACVFLWSPERKEGNLVEGNISWSGNSAYKHIVTLKMCSDHARFVLAKSISREFLVFLLANWEENARQSILARMSLYSSPWKNTS
jgi:hypothetical protein